MIAKTLQQVAAFFRRGERHVFNQEVSNYTKEELLRRAKKLEETYAKLANIACGLGKYTINSLDLAICFAPAEGYAWRPIARMRTEMSINSSIVGHGSRLTVGFHGLNKKYLLDFCGPAATFYPFQDFATDFEKKEFPDDYVSLDYKGDTVIDIKEENFDKDVKIFLQQQRLSLQLSSTFTKME